jgi:hypothetical protein
MSSAIKDGLRSSPMEAIGLGYALVWVVTLLIVIIAVAAIVDVIRRRDLTGGAKVLWVVLILILPVIGTIIYVIARPRLPEYGAGG